MDHASILVSQECDICYEYLEDPCIFKHCGHLMCKKCFCKYINTDAGLLCHICRQPVNKFNLGKKEYSVLSYKNKSTEKNTKFLQSLVQCVCIILLIIIVFFAIGCALNKFI